MTMVSGATYDPTTGEVSGYRNGTPIVYRYDCGTMQNGEAVTLTVTLNFTKPLMASEIRINSYEGKIYDGNVVSNPSDITKTAESNGAVTFEWFRKTADGNWESLGEEAPMNAGEYGVKAHLAADLHYAAADSGEPTPFEIIKAASNISINSYANKDWDGNPVSDPTDITRTQNGATVTFKYYRADDTTTEIAAPSEVGEYKVKAFLSGDANYTDSESDFVDFSILSLSTTVNLTYGDQVYTGNPVQDPQKDVHYTIEGSTGAVSIEWYNANDLTTPLEQAPANVGSYVVKVSVAGTSTHDGASATATFQITPAASTIRINSYESKEWDGNPVSNPTDITRTQNGATVTFKYYRADDTTTEIAAPSEVGEYKVKAFLSGDANYADSESDFVDFSIVAAKTTINLTYGDQVYTGNPVADPQKDAHYTVQGSTGDVTIEWYNANDLTTPLTQAPTNVGSYVVKVTVAATNTHIEASTTDSFQITPAASSIIINSYDGKVWDGNPVSDPTDITRTQNAATVTFKYYRADDTTTEITAPSEVGEYKVKAFLSGDANYTDSESNFVDFNIAALGTTITLTYGDQVYTGSPVADPQYTVEGSTGAVTIEWYEASDLTTPLAQAPTNVGSYVVKVNVAGTDTHTGASKTASFEITPATSTISINSYDGKVWDGNPVSNPTDITRTQNNATVTFKYYRADDTTTEIAAPSEVGEYKVKAFLSGDENYADSESDFVDFSIVAAKTTITFTYENQVYTGSPVADPQKDVHYTVEGSTGDVTIEWYEANDLKTPLAEAPTNVGSYVVKVNVAGTSTHDGASATASFQITPATSTISINSYEGKVYDGVAVSNPTNITTTGSDGAVTFEWFVKTEDGNWEPLEQAPVNAGEYGVKAH
ncbi:MAG: MBG domain-containing protein, partial [Erysipelotrichaceae bacterium]|nr:MBG domain-containing protein [Erysipelotrichaceae bacterium]